MRTLTLTAAHPSRDARGHVFVLGRDGPRGRTPDPPSPPAPRCECRLWRRLTVIPREENGGMVLSVLRRQAAIANEALRQAVAGLDPDELTPQQAEELFDVFDQAVRSAA